ncbi:hypothetical protein JOQ06_006001, partial [Pogonophryne albipinna]
DCKYPGSGEGVSGKLTAASWPWFVQMDEVDNLVANGHHLLSDPVDNPVNSGLRHPKCSGDHPVGCPTCQPEEEHQGLNGDTPSVSPFLTQEVQQRVQGLPAQPKIWPCVLVMKEPVQVIFILQYRGLGYKKSINATVPVLQQFFANEDTHPDFRLGREAIQQLLLALKMDRHHGWGATLETLEFLFWIANGSAYRVVSRVFNVPLPFVHRIVHRMVDEVVAVLPQFVRLPRAEDLPGAIDGCHIRIKCPSGPDGTVHDARILKNSPIYARGTYPPPGYFILADAGYPCQQEPLALITPYKRPVVTACVILHNICVGVGDDLPGEDATLKEDNQPPAAHGGGGARYFILADAGYPCLQEPLALITPYKRPVRGMAEQRFNYHHSRGRSIIERAFGVVTACVILHNICVGVGDDLPGEDATLEEDNQPPAAHGGGGASCPNSAPEKNI